MRRTGYIAFLLVLPGWLLGQSTDVANYRNMDWPLTTLKGQFRADLELNLGIGNKYFFGDGSAEKLDELGQTSTVSRYHLNLRYGVRDFLELSAELAYRSEVERYEPLLLFSSLLGTHQTTYIHENRGLEDPIIKVRFKWPLEADVYDLIAEAGTSLPVGAFGSQEPLHEYNYDAGASAETVNYHTISDPGMGVLGYYLGAAAKYRLSNVAFEARYRHIIPQGLSTDILWESIYNGSGFDYADLEYNKYYPAILELGAWIEYQVTPFFSLRAGGELLDSDHGWSAPEGEQVAMLHRRSIWLNLGADLIAGRSIWYRQEISIPVSGMNTVTPFVLRSRFTFNRLP